MIMALIFGLGAASTLFGAIVWSIRYPDRRIWPPQRFTSLHNAVVWSLAVVVFASAAAVGVFDWNSLGLPAALRWSVGLLLLVLGNVIVWGGGRPNRNASLEWRRRWARHQWVVRLLAQSAIPGRHCYSIWLGHSQRLVLGPAHCHGRHRRPRDRAFCRGALAFQSLRCRIRSLSEPDPSLSLVGKSSKPAGRTSAGAGGPQIRLVCDLSPLASPQERVVLQSCWPVIRRIRRLNVR